MWSPTWTPFEAGNCDLGLLDIALLTRNTGFLPWNSDEKGEDLRAWDFSFKEGKLQLLATLDTINFWLWWCCCVWPSQEETKLVLVKTSAIKRFKKNTAKLRLFFKFSQENWKKEEKRESEGLKEQSAEKGRKKTLYPEATANPKGGGVKFCVLVWNTEREEKEADKVELFRGSQEILNGRWRLG